MSEALRVKIAQRVEALDAELERIKREHTRAVEELRATKAALIAASKELAKVDPSVDVMDTLRKSGLL